jgi:hypothetical protein
MSHRPWDFLATFGNVMFQRASAPLITLLITFLTIITYSIITTIISYLSPFEMFPHIRVWFTTFPLFCGLFRYIRVLSFSSCINLYHINLLCGFKIQPWSHAKLQVKIISDILTEPTFAQYDSI